MGYDMMWADVDQAALNAMTFDERQKIYRTVYFRIGVFGMGDIAWDLERVGAVYRAPFPTFPKLEEFGDDKEAYRAACKLIVDAHGPGTSPGIPDYKLSSNDGWLVTAEECRQACSVAFNEHRSEVNRMEPYARQFLGWISKAKRHGGFRVF